MADSHGCHDVGECVEVLQPFMRAHAFCFCGEPAERNIVDLAIARGRKRGRGSPAVRTSLRKSSYRKASSRYFKRSRGTINRPRQVWFLPREEIHETTIWSKNTWGFHRLHQHCLHEVRLLSMVMQLCTSTSLQF